MVHEEAHDFKAVGLFVLDVLLQGGEGFVICELSRIAGVSLPGILLASKLSTRMNGGPFYLHFMVWITGM